MAPNHGNLGGSVLRGLALAFSLTFAQGCGEPDDPTGAKQDFWPDPATAEAALRASLDTWTPGRVQHSLKDRTPRVETWDSARVEGRALLGYEVIGPIGANDERLFAVRLRLDGPPEERSVKYLVRGIDPVWVFRWEDYERIAHWEHDMSGELPNPETPSPEQHSAEAHNPPAKSTP